MKVVILLFAISFSNLFCQPIELKVSDKLQNELDVKWEDLTSLAEQQMWNCEILSVKPRKLFIRHNQKTFMIKVGISNKMAKANYFLLKFETNVENFLNIGTLSETIDSAIFKLLVKDEFTNVVEFNPVYQMDTIKIYSMEHKYSESIDDVLEFVNR
jgi:hypothetical protein